MAWPTLAARPPQLLSAHCSPHCDGYVDLSPLKKRFTPLSRATTSSRRLRLFACKTVVSGRPAALPCLTAEELQETFGCQGLTFRDVDGAATAEMKLENGCRATLFLPRAQITSYQAHMWHGGEEEMLHNLSARSREGPSGITWNPRGGIDLQFFRVGDPAVSVVPCSAEGWSVADVRCEPSNYAQITLIGTTLLNEVGIQFRYMVTLTDESLSTALIVTNIGPDPVELMGSIVTHLAVSFSDSAFAVGLNGHSYFSHSSPKSKGADKNFALSNLFSRMMGSEPREEPGELLTPLSSAISIGANYMPGVIEQGRNIVEMENSSQLRAGEDRLYPEPPKSFKLMDRGYRRGAIFHRLGFEEFSVSNPGPKSELRDWDQFICLGPAQTLRPVRLKEYQEWRGAQILINTGHGPRTT